MLYQTLIVLALSAGAEPAKDSATASVPLLPADWEGTQKLVAAHKGQVVVVEIWTTTCGTCVDQFPKFVDLHRKYAERGVACIAVNCDYDGIKDKPPEFYRPQVEKFLRQQQARFENVLLTLSFIDLLNKLELESTPAALVYDRKGNLVKRFDNDGVTKEVDEFTPADVEKLVGKLLAE